MSSIKSVNTINSQITRLNTRFDEMVTASDAFSKFLFDKELFNDYGKYHTLLMNFSNKLITKTPLPNDAIPQNQFQPENPEGLDFKSLLQANGKSVIEGLLILDSIIAITVLAGMRIIPWIIPVLGAVGGVGVFCAPNLIEFLVKFLKKKDEDDLPVNSTNPSEWISHDLQIMSDEYDGIRILILRQNTKIERLASSYQKKDAAQYSRKSQEEQFFPNEVLTIVRKITVFCTNSYYELMDDLISHLPVSNSPSSQPQYQFPPGAS